MASIVNISQSQISGSPYWLIVKNIMKLQIRKLTTMASFELMSFEL